jgi:MFS family permease
MRRNVLLLAVCQALFMTGTSTVLTVTAVAGARIAPSPLLATLPYSLQFIATMATTIPASLLMHRIGRQGGFLIGSAVGAIGASLAAWGLASRAFTLFALGSALIGVLNGFAVFYRFAAADAADERFRSRAISLVMAGGIVAAFTGPNLARASVDWLGAPFVGSYAAVVAVHLVAMLVLLGIDIPRDRLADGSDSGRSIAAIVRAPVFVIALGSAVAGYAAMNLVMTATPPAMLAHGHSFSDATFVIQWHILGMFAPAFVTGSLIARFGATRIIATGAGLIVGCVAINLFGRDTAHFTAALILLGIGWNFMFVAATSLIGSAHTNAEKAKVQGLNDFVVFSVVALSSFSSGALETAVGWTAVNLAVVAPVVAAGAAAVWLGNHRRSAGPAAGKTQ